MYAIETSLGRFEADTEKDAKRELRKAQRAQAKKDAADAAAMKVARLKASEIAYQIYERKARGQDWQSTGWRRQIVRTNGDSWACQERYDEKRGERVYDIRAGHDGDTATVAPYDRITHYVENGAGWCVCVVIEIAHKGPELFAVGVHEGRACWVPVPGVLPEEFTAGKR